MGNREWWIAFNGDPSRDKETYKRYTGVWPYRGSKIPGEDIVHVIEKSAYDELKAQLAEKDKEIERLKESYNSLSRSYIEHTDEQAARIKELEIRLLRTVDAAYHALLEMSAWLGIPEKKRHAQIKEFMENVNFCAENDIEDQKGEKRWNFLRKRISQIED